MPKRIDFWFLLITAIIVSRLLSMWLLPFIDTTEPRYAEIARLMAESGDWITPWFETGVPFWGKPPLSFWAQAGAIKVFGTSEMAIRLPSLLVMLLTLLVLWRYAMIKSGSEVARWTALVFMTMALTFVSTGAVMTDPFLLLGTTLSLTGFDIATHGRHRLWGWLFFAGIVIGLLAKGPVALVLTAIPIMLYFLINPGQWRECAALPWLKGSMVTVLLVLPWYIAAEMKTPGFLDYFIIGEHVRRFIDPGWAGDLYGSAHDQPKGMIWVYWIWASFPWGVVVLVLYARQAWKQGFKKVALALRSDRNQQFLILAALAPLLFFTVAGNTLWTYALPSLPFSALLIAQWLETQRQQGSLSGLLPSRGTAYALKLSIALVPAAVTFGAFAVYTGHIPVNTQKSLVRAFGELVQVEDSPLLYVDKLPFSARFYSLGDAQLVTTEQIYDMLENPVYHQYFVAVPLREHDNFRSGIHAQVKVQIENEKYQLLRITPDKVSNDESS